MTDNAYAEDFKKALDSGMNEHIAKPITIDPIAQAISSATEDISAKEETANEDN